MKKVGKIQRFSAGKKIVFYGKRIESRNNNTNEKSNDSLGKDSISRGTENIFNLEIWFEGLEKGLNRPA